MQQDALGNNPELIERNTINIRKRKENTKGNLAENKKRSDVNTTDIWLEMLKMSTIRNNKAKPSI